MFCVKQPFTLGRPWRLSNSNEDNEIEVPLKITKLLRNHHIMGVEFLYHNYRRGFKGAILNQPSEMNLALQIVAFLCAVMKETGKILIICPDNALPLWHYYLDTLGRFTVLIANETSLDRKCGSYNERLAYLLGQSEWGVVNDFIGEDLFAVVVDSFDQVANKMKFPDQKLQWHMLNWSNPNCVGKLQDFPLIDNKNTFYYRDNYRPWWLRLTPKFCDSFKLPTDQEKQNFEDELKSWSQQNHFEYFHVMEKTKPTKRRSAERPPKKSKKIKEEPDDNYVKLPSMDASPIVTSIIRNFQMLKEHRNVSADTQSQPTNCTKLLLPDTSKCLATSSSEEFILSLIGNPIVKENKPMNLDEDIKKLLCETDSLLQN